MRYQITLTFKERLLGTAPLDKEVYTSYIAEKKAELTPDELNDEVATINEEKGMTGFHAEDGRPFLYDYTIKGFFKDSCSMLRRVAGSPSSKVTAYKKIIDGLVFIEERRIYLNLSGPMGTLERPLRAQTAQGERVALAKSEAAPIGTTVTFTLNILDDTAVPEALLRQWFDYGALRGLGAWRNASWGAFTYTLEALQ